VINGPALAERLAYYTGDAFEPVDFKIDRAGVEPVLTLTIGPSAAPIAFTKSAAFTPSSNASQRDQLFAAGSFYFRHGELSEPGTTADMLAFKQRLLRQTAAQWFHEIRRLLSNSTDELETSQPERSAVVANAAAPQPVRIVVDPTAPVLQPQDVDRLYPLRQKDLVRQLNRQFGQRLVNSYDIQAVRRQHRLDERPDFVFYLPGAGRRYSPAAAEWIAQQYRSDAEFFRRARAADHATLLLRRKKPR
jgi:hypothetical protein